jgi:DNA-binding MarR family transcriptional regulator
VSLDRTPSAARGGADASGAAPDGSSVTSESIALLMRIGLFGMRTAFKQALAKHGVAWSSWYYLRVLWEGDGISQRELTERVGTMQPNTVSALRQLKKSGLVRVEQSAVERRRTHVWLTPKARRLMVRVLPDILNVEREVALGGFSERDEADLRRLLEKICGNVLRHAERTRQLGSKA